MAENVTDLLRMRNGREFAASLAALSEHGYRNIALAGDLLNSERGQAPHSLRALAIPVTWVLT